eukprot:3641202-Rhodomonas_salina.1
MAETVVEVEMINHCVKGGGDLPCTRCIAARGLGVIVRLTTENLTRTREGHVEFPLAREPA